MKKLLLLFIPLVFFFSCDQNDDSENTSYNCSNDECYSVDGGSGQYATLDDCLNSCDCSCGEITLIPDFNPPTSYTIPDPIKGGFTTITSSGYSLFLVENYCSGNVGTGCVIWDLGEEGPQSGDTHCMEWSEYFWTDGTLDGNDICFSDSLTLFSDL